MNEDLKRLYLSIRKMFPFYPAYKAIASARESYDIANRILTDIRTGNNLE